MLARMCIKANTHPLLVGVQTWTAIVEICLEVPQKFEDQSITKSSYITLGYKSKGHFSLQKRHLSNHVYYCPICNNQKLETTLSLKDGNG